MSVFVVVHLTTTNDEFAAGGAGGSQYFTRDTAETVEFSWSLVGCDKLDVLSTESIVIKPLHLSVLSSVLTPTFAKRVVDTGVSFKECIAQFDQFIQTNVISKNLDFTFVTLNSWDLRVQIPREARDKGCILPAYLQHVKVFDLKHEYLKWQIHHPETLSYSVSNLNNICTALEVEDYKISIGSPFIPNNSGLLDEFYSLNNVKLFTKILISLVKKSTPVQDHLDVMTRPFDLCIDVKNFLNERSKILYLSNLPNDTTQSELESWFTSFGGRPLAFWTLKSADHNMKSSGSGFAVFSSHEEATESLGINGRGLNDKSIEIQPSSSRVLDRAQEILTPFPPSKNRPRPGDWNCPSCGFSNFQRRTACFRCSFPATSAVTIQESIYTTPNGSNSDILSPSTTNSNSTHGHIHNHNHSHHNNNSNNNLNSINNGRSNSVPFRAGDWKCFNENCSYHNFAKNVCCLRCGAPRNGNNSSNSNNSNSNNNNSNNNNHNNTNNHSNNFSSEFDITSKINKLIIND